MTRTLSLAAAVFALCMSCSPEPESTEGGTMPSSGAIICDSLRGAHFRSVLGTLLSGMGPDGPLTGHYYLNFSASGQGFEYNREDYTMRGLYDCTENVLRARVDGLNTSISATLDPLTGILTWEGIEFERVK